MPKHILIKLSKIKYKEKILKAVKPGVDPSKRSTKIDKLLAKLNKKREKTQIAKIKNERGILLLTLQKSKAL